jgi:hypothetical protein
MGKGDARYKDRQQCSTEIMELRWKLAFEDLTNDEVFAIEAKIKELETKCTTNA